MTLPPGWLARLASILLKMPQIDQMGETSVKDTLFYIEMSLRSVSDKLVLADESKSPSTSSTLQLPAPLIPIKTDEDHHTNGGGDGGANSPEFSLISN